MAESFNVTDVTDDTFKEKVLQAAHPTLVDFWAEWCGPCRMIAPVVGELATEYAGRLRVAKLDVDANPNTVRRLGIMSIPVLILFKDGKEVTRIVGYRSRVELEEKLLPHIE